MSRLTTRPNVVENHLFEMHLFSKMRLQHDEARSVDRPGILATDVRRCQLCL